MLKDAKNMSERMACRVVGLSRSTYRRLPLAQTPADPDAGMRAQLRTYARKHPRHGFRRAWAHLRFDDGIEVNKKKVHRLWTEEGLQVRRAPRRKRAGQSSVPIVAADRRGHRNGPERAVLHCPRPPTPLRSATGPGRSPVGEGGHLLRAPTSAGLNPPQ